LPFNKKLVQAWLVIGANAKVKDRETAIILLNSISFIYVLSRLKVKFFCSTKILYLIFIIDLTKPCQIKHLISGVR
jgi:hypothetical protein